MAAAAADLLLPDSLQLGLLLLMVEMREVGWL
jgi:hypothetical protein